jgi:hypothetical protein
MMIELNGALQYCELEHTAPDFSVLASNINANRWDNNLRSGIVANQIDFLTKFDISNNGFHFDTSVESFYDAVYAQKAGSQTYNPAKEPTDKLSAMTRTHAGCSVEPRTPFVGPKETYWDSSSLLVEVAGDNLLGFDNNRENFSTSQRHMALGFHALGQLTYCEALPGLQLNPYIGLGWNFMGLAPDTPGSTTRVSIATLT